MQATADERIVLKSTADPSVRAFYTSVLDRSDRGYCLALGPFAHPDRAKVYKPLVRRYIIDHLRDGVWCSWGIASVAPGIEYPLGKLNEILGITPDVIDDNAPQPIASPIPVPALELIYYRPFAELGADCQRCRRNGRRACACEPGRVKADLYDLHWEVRRMQSSVRAASYRTQIAASINTAGAIRRNLYRMRYALRGERPYKAGQHKAEMDAQARATLLAKLRFDRRLERARIERATAFIAQQGWGLQSLPLAS